MDELVRQPRGEAAAAAAADVRDGVPAVTNVGRRGGSGLAAGLTNELVHVASDARDGEVSLEPERRAEGDATPPAPEDDR